MIYIDAKFIGINAQVDYAVAGIFCPEIVKVETLCFVYKIG